MTVVSALLQDEVNDAFKELPNFVTVGDVSERIFQKRLERNIPPYLHEEAKRRGALHPLWLDGRVVHDVLVSLGYELVAPIGGR